MFEAFAELRKVREAAQLVAADAGGAGWVGDCSLGDDCSLGAALHLALPMGVSGRYAWLAFTGEAAATAL